LRRHARIESVAPSQKPQVIKPAASSAGAAGGKLSIKVPAKAVKPRTQTLSGACIRTMAPMCHIHPLKASRSAVVLSTVWASLPVPLFALNPVIQAMYAAGPAPMVHQGTLYLFSTSTKK